MRPLDLFTNFDDNMNKIEFAQNVIIVEFTMILLIVFLSYSLIFIVRLQRKKRLRYIIEITNYINANYINKGFSDNAILPKFKSSWKKIALIVPVLFQFNKKHHQNAAWKKSQKFFCTTILFPIAKKAASEHNWLSRFYAAQAFSLEPYDADEDIILQLLDDSVPLVFYASLEAAVKNPTNRSIAKIVERLSKENWITKSLFIQVFQNAPTTTRYLVENILIGSTEPLMRSTCYTILLQFKMSHLRWDMSSDLNSKFINLKISALKYIAHTHAKEATPILVLHLKDKSWEVRTICLRLLGEIGAKKAIEPVAACLTDPDWWVRLASATTLRNFGQEGIKILESEKNKIHPDAFNAAYNVLNKL